MEYFATFNQKTFIILNNIYFNKIINKFILILSSNACSTIIIIIEMEDKYEKQR